MPWIEGEAAQQLKRSGEAQNLELRREQLLEAQSVAKQIGKETFDLEKLKGLYEPERYKDEELEYKYYVLHPEITTLTEFADLLKELEFLTHGY
jgi:hypothetical protein